MVLMVTLIVLNFAGIFCFGSSLLTDGKIEVGIFMIGCCTNSIIANACSRRRSETRNVFAMVE